MPKKTVSKVEEFELEEVKIVPAARSYSLSTEPATRKTTPSKRRHRKKWSYESEPFMPIETAEDFHDALIELDVGIEVKKDALTDRDIKRFISKYKKQYDESCSVVKKTDTGNKTEKGDIIYNVLFKVVKHNLLKHRLKTILDFYNLSRSDLVEKSGLNRYTIYRIFNESPIPNSATISKIIKALEIDTTDLAYEPEGSHEDWEDWATDNYRLRFDFITGEDVRKMPYSMLKSLLLQYTSDLLVDDNDVALPRKHRMMFKQQILFAIDTMDELISQSKTNHIENKTKK